MSRKAKIIIRNLTKAFYKKQGSVTALDDINLTINDGEFVCIVGPSGCGKSTLLRILAGLETPSIGEFTIAIATDGEDRPLQSMVFQERGIIPWLTVEKNVAVRTQNASYAEKIHKRAYGVLFEKDRSRKIFIPLSERAIWGHETTGEHCACICQ